MATMQKKTSMSDTLRAASGFAAGGDGGRALANAMETWFAAASESQREMIGFMSMRLEKNTGTMRNMMGCRSLADVAAIQTRWMEEALRDYNSEVSKLMTIYVKSANGGARGQG